MTYNLTRRGFLGDVTKLGLASALNLPALSESAIPAHFERKSNFDSQWQFFKGDIEGAQSPEFHDGTWRTLDLPHDWSIEGPISEDAPAAGTGAYLPTGIGWYRKQFILPSAARGKHVTLQFDGVYQRSEVWINGASLGMRPYGFSTFFYDLTPHLRPHGKPNQIAVRVDNSLQPNCRWYSGSGIYRHTWLIVTDPIHIAPWGTFVRTPVVSSQNASVEVTTRVMNEGEQDAGCELTTEILDAKGSVIQQSASTMSIQRGADTTFSHHLQVASPALWSVSTPNLYRVRSTLKTRGVQLDQETTTFGIRQIEFDANRGFLLNGEHVKMNGVCIHGDCGSVGTAVPERMWERRLELLRSMGCNAIRLSHNPPNPELLDMLDRMGFLVMAEAFDEWKQPKLQTPQYGYHKYFDEWSARDMAAMVERDRNHPSIVIWSAGNEVPDQTDPQGPETLQTLLDVIRSNDPTRPVTVACDNIAAQPKATLPEFLAKLDVVGYNYVDRWRDRREKFYAIDRHAYPERRFIGTETSSIFGPRGAYAIEEPDDPFFGRAANTAIEVEQLQKFIQTYDYVSGDFIWTGIDYLGESRWPSKIASSGALDTCGFPKDAFYFYQSRWTSEPVLHLFPHWNWKGHEDKVITVTCYTNCDTVELFLNGKSFGVKGYAFPRPGMVGKYGNYPPRAKALQTTADLHLSWDVPFAAGTLTAKGTKDGKVIRQVEIHTTGEPAKLALVPDRSSISTRPSDVAHITVQVLDAEGRVVPTADDEVTFTLRGAGRILGVDNGRPDSHESYQGPTRRAFNGLALVVIQSNGGSGTATLSASSGSLSPVEVAIEFSAGSPARG
ncbi:MAG TPA: glycoside hydrolase family 2 TIM barrel-domain containing protein [Acidobacteriaceae bacterium]|nr:glycoside hydrolase family 2 TIM barrel-domain containing protein [Acidobacteriaceae bacterium]